VEASKASISDALGFGFLAAGMNLASAFQQEESRGWENAFRQSMTGKVDGGRCSAE